LKGEYIYRLKYAKTNDARYISHLDFVRVLNRAMRRSNFSVTYTEGFNPHAVMAVASPISVGVTSECEYMDIDMDNKVSPNEVAERFNEVFPPGIRVLEAKILDESDVKFKHIDSARYRVDIEMLTETLPDIQAFMNMDTIVVPKKSKSAVKDVDLKPDIYGFELVSHSGKFIGLEIEAASGNYNVKPELVVEAMKKYIDGFDVEFMQVHRIGLYAKGKALM